ncbi:ABC transporter permease [Vagococcus acidifermentans]|uniref:Choline ABC transporter permease n=1 Tax=Vagococcus acidifermentans TaxID=564710 RepID=A0A430ARI9_9ENTE|nr:ABC transporter permease [Vagococcus acidifermentans]RSU10671.1 choline ABC transporter permease [Vagococcus acidifermentans]
MYSFLSYVANNLDDIGKALGQHVMISGVSVLLGIVVAFPAGILLTKNKSLANFVLGVFSVVNTIPSLVLLGVAMIVLGLGFVPAVAVLFLYSLLPIMRNTYTGISNIEEKYIKAAVGMGMSKWQLLLSVQLPLALPAIITGVRLSSIYIISWATLSAFIGAGGLGDLIWSGLQSYNYNMIFAGAVPATLLALLVSFLLSSAEKRATQFSRGRKEVKT